MTRQDVARVAAEAGVDPRTVERALLLGAVRSVSTRLAILVALRALGFSREAFCLEKGQPS